MFRIFGLLLILALAFCMAFIPHIGYAYPLHVDEWMHMTYAETIAHTGSITFSDPFTGLTNINLGDNLWVGYHILWAMFQQVSGIPWIPIFLYFPPIIFMLTVLAVYILANREGYGLEAAFFTCLIPTTGGLLGPAFMVPMALAMLFIPLSLFLAFNIKAWPSYLLIFLFISLLLISHAATVLVLFIILAPYILLNIKNNRWHSAGVLAALALPFVLSLPWTFQIAMQTALQLVVPQPMSSYVEFPDLIGKFGLLPIAFSFIGTVVLIIKGGKKNIGLVLGLGLLLIVFLVFIRFHYGLSTIYERGLTAMLLILSILAGAGLFWLRKLRLPREFLEKHKSVLLANAAVIACVILTVVILVIAIPARASAVFYHMIDDEDYRAFTWTKDNIGAEYDTALLDPWKATAFTAITGRNVASRIWFQTEPVDAAIYRFLADGCEDNIVFQDFGGTLVYNLTPCNNPDVIEVRHNIYITNPGSLSALGPRNILRNAGFAPIYGAPPVFWSTYLQNCKAIFAYPQPGRAGDSSIGIRITGIEGANPIPAALWSQRVPVQAGKSYTIGGWIRTEDVTGQDGAMIMPQWKGPSYSWISVTGFMPYIRGTGDWTYYIGRVTAPAGAEFCDVCCIMTDCTGSSWFNDILFEEEK